MDLFSQKKIKKEFAIRFNLYNNIKSMRKAKFLPVINQLCSEKNLSKEIVIDAVKTALVIAYNKNFAQKKDALNLEVILDEKEDELKIFKVLEVVKKVEDEHKEIKLSEAKEHEKDIKVGEEIKIDVTPTESEWGRISAQTAKQIISQRIAQAEKEMIYDKFKNLEGEILQATVFRVDRGQVFLEFQGINAILPPRFQIKSERYYPGQKVKIYLNRVVKLSGGSELYISRTHPNLVKKIFENEIPEIKNGTVEVKAIAREPGVRTKIAVDSNDRNVDPVGACVGQKGNRIKTIMSEVGNEYIDIIEWTEDVTELATRSLSPAKVSRTELDEKSNKILAFVVESERALAIGRRGQNVQLAGRLCGHEIDITTVSDVEAMAEVKVKKKVDQMQKIEDVDEFDDDLKGKLKNVGFEFVGQLSGLGESYLKDIEGITDEEIKKILEYI